MTDALLSILVSALVLGSLYSLMASGLSLIWSTLGVFNYAHGALLLLGGAYFIWTFSEKVGLPVLLAFAAAVPLLALLGMLLDLVAVRPFISRPNGTLLVMVSTLAIANAVEGAAQLVWGGPQNKQIKSVSTSTFAMGDVKIASSTLIALGLALVLVIGLIMLLRTTKWGDGRPGSGTKQGYGNARRNQAGAHIRRRLCGRINAGLRRRLRLWNHHHHYSH